MTNGTLYLVATPIGNLSDISERVVSTLKVVDIIAAEDTRVTRKLISHLCIKKPLLCYREDNRQVASEKILARLQSGESCALVTDAGTPGISDPGEFLVRQCTHAGIPVTIIPGPCAAIAALAVSGFSTDRFTFEGFLPTDKKKRQSRLSELEQEKRTMIFYEAPHKLMRTLKDMRDMLGDRHISVSREMTKLFEETQRFALSEALAYFEANQPRGEFVLIVEGAVDNPASDDGLREAAQTAIQLINNGFSLRDAVKKAAHDTGCSRNDLYKVMISTSAD